MADLPTLRLPTEADIDELVLRMRAADVAEVQAAGHTDLRAAVADSVKRSTVAYAAHVDDTLACIFGLAPLNGQLLTDYGVPWLLGTDEMLRRRAVLMRVAPGYIADMRRLYPILVNCVHAENIKAVAWLKRMGFALADAKPYGPKQAPFRLFQMGPSNV